MTAAALKRLRGDNDFQRVGEWLARALAERDKQNRALMDGVMLRQGQGAALTLAEISAMFQGRSAGTGALSDTRDSVAASSNRIP